jgi:hypothetical protein
MEENTITSSKAKDFFLANINAKAKPSEIATERRQVDEVRDEATNSTH